MSLKEAADAALVARVCAGDRAAAEVLARRHLPACRAVALAVTGDDALADDIAQDAFVSAIERIDDCRQPARFGSWLGQIARNRARDLMKAPRWHATVSLEHAQPVAPESPEIDAQRSELRTRLAAALAELPEERRIAVVLHDLEGWPHREIAALLDLPAGTVRSHVHLARTALRRRLSDFGDDE